LSQAGQDKWVAGEVFNEKTGGFDVEAAEDRVFAYRKKSWLTVRWK
jgi:hypothetical protein